MFDYAMPFACRAFWLADAMMARFRFFSDIFSFYASRHAMPPAMLTPAAARRDYFADKERAADALPPYDRCIYRLRFTPYDDYFFDITPYRFVFRR